MRRKRSFLVAAFLASTALAPLIAGCEKRPDPVPQPVVYKTTAECVADGNKQDVCVAALTTAANSPDRPKYSAKAQCEAEFGTGNCETRHDSNGGGDSFMPFMMGYMLGGGGGGGTTVVHRYTPVYASRTHGYYVGSRPAPATYHAATYSSGARSFSSSSSSRAFSGTTSRGGFGASAASHGGFSGG